MAKSGQHGGNVIQMAQEHGLKPEQVIDFSANINPLGMPHSVKQAIIEQLDCVVHYPDIDYLKLHQAIAAHHQLPVQQVIAGNGATELIFLWTNHIKPKKALLVEPSFAEYRRALARVDCEIVQFDLRESEQFALTPKLLDALDTSLDALFLCTPNNPTGLMPDHDLLLAIVARCHALDIALFIDESFIDFMGNTPSLVAQLADYPNLSILRSLTKFYAMPGLRLGYLLSSNDVLLAQMREQREPWTINALAALAGEVLFSDTQFVKNTLHWLEQEQTFVWQELSQLSGITMYRPSANYLFFKHLEPNSQLQAQMMKHGILIRSCANYPTLNQQFFRIAIKSRAANIQLISALKEVLHHG